MAFFAPLEAKQLLACRCCHRCTKQCRPIYKSPNFCRASFFPPRGPTQYYQRFPNTSHLQLQNETCPARPGGLLLGDFTFPNFWVLQIISSMMLFYLQFIFFVILSTGQGYFLDIMIRWLLSSFLAFMVVQNSHLIIM